MKRYLAGFAAGAFAAAVAAAALWQGIQHAEGQAITSVQLPVATVTSVGASAVQIAPQNPGRRTFSICNGAGSIALLPGTATTVTAANGIQLAANTCLSPPANLLQSGTMGGGGNSWQAIQNSGASVVAFIEW